MSYEALTILGEHATYPGHPVTLAYLIVRLYPSLEAASARGHRYLAVEEDGRLPGAGGQNSQALDLLRNLNQGIEWDLAVASADRAWGCTDGQAEGGGSYAKTEEARQHYLTRWKEGQEQADRIKPLLREAVSTWS